ncbi:hypothetical protein T439DRAFT_328565 [Meredithblackwellia eburnea MCA 4105]
MYDPKTGRLRAIQLPCCFCRLQHRPAAILVSGFGSAAYAAWGVVLWMMGSALSKLSVSTSEETTVQAMRSFVNFADFYAFTASAIYLAFFAISFFPNSDALKHLSRIIWVGWCTSWLVGILGLVAFGTGDSFLMQDCTAGKWSGDCESWWNQMQVGLIVLVFTTLGFHFYSGIVLSSFVHTLHPHLFYQHSDDEEFNDYYDDEDEKHTLPVVSGRQADSHDHDGARRRSHSARRGGDEENDEDEAYKDRSRSQDNLAHLDSESGSGGEESDEEFSDDAMDVLQRSHDEEAARGLDRRGGSRRSSVIISRGSQTNLSKKEGRGGGDRCSQQSDSGSSSEEDSEEQHLFMQKRGSSLTRGGSNSLLD